MTRLTSRIVATCTVAVCALSFGPLSAAYAQQSAVLGKNGDIVLNRSEGESFASVRAAIFEPGWALRGATFDTASGTARITAATAGSVVTVKPTVTAEGNTLKVSVAFTANKNTPVNTHHVSIVVPVNRYVDGVATLKDASGTKMFPIPTSPKDAHIAQGSSGELSLSSKGGANLVRVTATGNNAVLLQDNRAFSGSDLEIRVGSLAEHTLKAGQTETVSFTLEVLETIAVTEEKPLTLQAGPDWIPLSPKTLDIAPGSALDFSPFMEKGTTTQYGWITARPDGHFGFEKRDKPQRFYGVNLCFGANYLEHDEADKLAVRLKRLGYNTVRIHHYEGDLINQNAPDSLTFREDNLDKLDYLMAAFRKNGLYVTTDLFVSRPVKPAEMGLEAGGMDDFKDAVLVSKPAMANWKAFSKKFLEHVNPYTGVAYKDDPTLAWIAMINEPALTNGRLGAWKGKLRELFVAEWGTWYGKRYPGKPAPALPGNVEDNALGRDVAAFFAYLHQRGYDEMRDYLRKDIGTRALLTYLNGWSETPAFLAVRQSFDYVDNHFYWDHPSFLGASWGLPSTGWSGNASAVTAGGAGPDGIAMTRLVGKPFTVTEWDYVSPNRYRAEGSLLMSAVASLQDWDAIWHFAYSHGHDGAIKPIPADYFNVAQDPLRQASERVGILLYLRGDAKPATGLMAATVSAPSLLTPGDKLPAYPSYRSETNFQKVGVRVLPGPMPNMPVPPPAPTHNEETRVSETKQLFITPEKGMMVVDTPRTLGAVLAQPGQTAGTGAVKLDFKETRAMISASALDNKPLASSKRLLLLHLTDLQNAGEKFSAQDRRVLEAWGTLPYLVRRGSATVTISRPDAAKLKAFRLDTSGNRVAPLPIQATGNTATLELSTLAPDGSATLYYEVIAP